MTSRRKQNQGSKVLSKKESDQVSQGKSFRCQKCNGLFKTIVELSHGSLNHSAKICKDEAKRLAELKAKAEAHRQAKIAAAKNRNKERDSNRKAAEKMKKNGKKAGKQGNCKNKKTATIADREKNKPRNKLS